MPSLYRAYRISALLSSGQGEEALFQSSTEGTHTLEAQSGFCDLPGIWFKELQGFAKAHPLYEQSG